MNRRWRFRFPGVQKRLCGLVFWGLASPLAALALGIVQSPQGPSRSCEGFAQESAAEAASPDLAADETGGAASLIARSQLFFGPAFRKDAGALVENGSRASGKEKADCPPWSLRDQQI